MTQLSPPTVCDDKSKRTKRKCNKRRKLSFLSKVSRFVTLSRAPQRKKSSKLDRRKSRRVTVREREKYAADKAKASTVGEEDEFPECLSEDEDEPSLNVVRERLSKTTVRKTTTLKIPDTNAVLRDINLTSNVVCTINRAIQEQVNGKLDNSPPNQTPVGNGQTMQDTNTLGSEIIIQINIELKESPGGNNVASHCATCMKKRREAETVDTDEIPFKQPVAAEQCRSDILQPLNTYFTTHMRRDTGEIDGNLGSGRLKRRNAFKHKKQFRGYSEPDQISDAVANVYNGDDNVFVTIASPLSAPGKVKSTFENYFNQLDANNNVCTNDLNNPIHAGSTIGRETFFSNGSDSEANLSYVDLERQTHDNKQFKQKDGRGPVYRRERHLRRECVRRISSKKLYLGKNNSLSIHRISSYEQYKHMNVNGLSESLYGYDSHTSSSAFSESKTMPSVSHHSGSQNDLNTCSTYLNIPVGSSSYSDQCFSVKRAMSSCSSYVSVRSAKDRYDTTSMSRTTSQTYRKKTFSSRSSQTFCKKVYSSCRSSTSVFVSQKGKRFHLSGTSSVSSRTSCMSEMSSTSTLTRGSNLSWSLVSLPTTDENNDDDCVFFPVYVDEIHGLDTVYAPNRFSSSSIHIYDNNFY